MKLAIVVLNWRNVAATSECVESLLQGIDHSRIYIIDNHSCDGSTEVLKRKFPACQIFENTENSGYTGGNNFGLEKAFRQGHDAALILNNDINPHLAKDFVSRVDQLLRNDPNTLIGIPVRDMKGHTVFPHRPGFFMRALFRACGISMMTPLICGCAMVISKQTFDAIGGLEERFFMYCEELDYSVRVAMHGGRVVCPVELGHVVRDDDDERLPYIYYYQARNLLLLIKNHAAHSKMSIALASIVIALKQALISGRIVNVLRTWQGIAHGLSGRTGRTPSAHR